MLILFMKIFKLLAYIPYKVRSNVIDLFIKSKLIVLIDNAHLNDIHCNQISIKNSYINILSNKKAIHPIEKSIFLLGCILCYKETRTWEEYTI